MKGPAVLERGRIKVDTASRRVWVNGHLIRGRVGPKRFELLCVLLRHTGPVSREELRDVVWGGGEDMKTVDRTISRLRADLGLKEGEVIVSFPRGYSLVG